MKLLQLPHLFMVGTTVLGAAVPQQHDQDATDQLTHRSWGPFNHGRMTIDYIVASTHQMTAESAKAVGYALTNTIINGHQCVLSQLGIEWGERGGAHAQSDHSPLAAGYSFGTNQLANILQINNHQEAFAEGIKKIILAGYHGHYGFNKVRVLVTYAGEFVGYVWVAVGSIDDHHGERDEQESIKKGECKSDSDASKEQIKEEGHDIAEKELEIEVKKKSQD